MAHFIALLSSSALRSICMTSDRKQFSHVQRSFSRAHWSCGLGFIRRGFGFFSMPPLCFFLAD